MLNNKFNKYYWLRKIYVSKIFQYLPINKSFLRKLVFTSIFKSNHWVQNSSNLPNEFVSVSGHGSNINTTQFNNLILSLKKFLENYKIESILDMPCGDFLWMNQFLKIKKIKYLGIDIVEEIIKKNKLLYENENIKFRSCDINNFISNDNFDLVFMRDFFIHIKNSDILKILNNIRKMNIKYFAFENYQVTNNIENSIGKHRKINLEIKPFNLGQPIYKFKDFEKDKDIYFYEKKTLNNLF